MYSKIIKIKSEPDFNELYSKFFKKPDTSYLLNFCKNEDNILLINDYSNLDYLEFYNMLKNIDFVDFYSNELNIIINSSSNKKFDIILLPLNIINELSSNIELEKYLYSLKKIMNKDGVIIIDCINPIIGFLLRDHSQKYNQKILFDNKNNIYYDYYEQNQYFKNSQNFKVVKKFTQCDQFGNIFKNKSYSYNKLLCIFFPSELDFIIKTAGFKIINKYDWYDLSEFRGKTTQQLFVLKNN